MDEKYWENLYSNFKNFELSQLAGDDLMSLEEFKNYVNEDPLSFYHNH